MAGDISRLGNALRTSIGSAGAGMLANVPTTPFGGSRGGVGLFFGKKQMFGLDIEFSPTVAFLVKNFNDMGVDIRSYKEPLKRSIQKVLAPSFQKNFDVGGRPPWPPLSEYTLKMRSEEGSGNQILVRSGRLKRTAGQLNIWEIDGVRGQAFVRSLPSHSWYGNIHQGVSSGLGFESFVLGPTEQSDDGGSLFAASGETPPRPFIVVQKEDFEEVQKVFSDWINERLTLQLAKRGF